MALSDATPAFQRAASSGAQFRAFDSGFRDRSSGHAANPTRGSDVGARSAYRFVELGRSTRMGRLHRDVSADGLCVLVVALGKPHGSGFLAIP